MTVKASRGGAKAARKPAKTTIASVTKAMAVLSEVARHSSGVAATEVADTLGLPLPTAYHLLNTLTQEAALTKSGDRRYRLGPRIGMLSTAYFDQTDPGEHLLVPLRRLADKTGETAYLSGWMGPEIQVLASAEGSHAVRVAGLQKGAHGHAHARASGKLLLAFASESVRENYLARHKLTKLTPNTLTTRESIEEEFERIRVDGVAIDDEEYSREIACVAAPIRFEDVVVAAYTISAPVDRFHSNSDQLTRSVLNAAKHAGTK
jgi:DNA-binding IclR family transcriptional regulator